MFPLSVFNSGISKLGSMAIRCPSLPIRIPGSDVKKHTLPAKVPILCNIYMPHSRKSSTSITCFSYKVFEDKSKGIICYQDDQGEVICEGYDEGPRICQPDLPNRYGKREFQIPDFLQLPLLQTTEGIEFRCIKLGASVKDQGLDCVDLNGLC